MLKPSKQSKDTINYDSTNFWAKIEVPELGNGFVASKILLYENNDISLVCPRPIKKSFLKEINHKPFLPGTKITLAFQNQNIFELWKAEIEQFVGFRGNLDEYSIQNMYIVTEETKRKKNRFITEIPLRIQTKNNGKKFYRFKGCEISETGLGLWLPLSLQSKIILDKEYNISFEANEVKPFGFTVKCIRPNSEDHFSRGFTAGFIFVDEEEKSKLSFKRIKQLIAARGKIRNITLNEYEKKSKHLLEDYWIGEYFETFE